LTQQEAKDSMCFFCKSFYCVDIIANTLFKSMPKTN